MLMGKGLHRERQGEQVRLLAVPTSPGLGAGSSGTERAGLSRVAGSRRVRVAESRWLWSRSFTNQQQNNAAEPWSSTRFTSNCTPAGDQSTAPYSEGPLRAQGTPRRVGSKRTHGPQLGCPWGQPEVRERPAAAGHLGKARRACLHHSPTHWGLRIRVTGTWPASTETAHMPFKLYTHKRA